MSRNLYFEDEVVKNSFNFHMLGKLFSYAKKYKKTYIFVIILLVTNSILSLIPASLNAKIINDVLPFNGRLQDNYFRTAVIILSIWASILCCQIITNYFSTKVTTRLGNSIVYEIRQDLFRHLMKLGFDYYDSRPTGKILVRITNYTSEIADIFVGHLTTIIINVLMMVACLISICFMDIRLAVVVILAEIPFSLIVWLLVRELQKRARLTKNKASNRTAFVAEDINGIEVIKAFNREKLNEQIHEELSTKHFRAHMRFTNVNEAFYPLSHGVIRIISNILLYTVALVIIIKNPTSLTLGVLVSVTTYMQMFAEALFSLCQRFQNIATLTTNMERIFEVLETEPKVKDSEDAYEMPEIKGKVSLRNATFSYDGTNYILEKVNLEVESGETIAIVGPTGAGKTTIVNLLSRFYNLDSGEILIDGHNINQVTLKSLRRQVGVMMQDTFLFSGEIIENIRFSKPEATDEECINAAKKVYADDFIQKLPEGYHTKIKSAASELSSGERQLLSFARLVLADPKIIILDEATSNIDTQTERKIQAMMEHVLKNRTSFIIAHRLSTIKNADRILYIEDKNIAESGNHEELMQLKGKYYELVAKH
ncbi:MAG TPA: ABC transporter ATP-binding protein [Mobilitalea sp.]|nr:ABC transporter ATP-binding protein [Mobilitalea sp.]